MQDIGREVVLAAGDKQLVARKPITAIVPGFGTATQQAWATGVPAEALERLRSAFRATMDDPEVLQALRKTGVEEVGRMPLAQISEQMRLTQIMGYQNNWNVQALA